MMSKNIDTSMIEQSLLIVQHPFVYDTQKIKVLGKSDFVKLNPEYLKDFFPYTKNFFGNYHFQDSIDFCITQPFIMAIEDIKTINFLEDSNMKDMIHIASIEVYIFEKNIGILSITYEFQDKLQDKSYAYYHQKLSMLEKRTKQKLITSQNKIFNYYFEFIDDILFPFCSNNNIFGRSNLYTYNILQVNYLENSENSNGFIETLTQYRNKIVPSNANKLNIEYVQQTSNIATIANENVVIHFGFKIEKDNNDFINSEFINKYRYNHFLIYIICLYQLSNIEYLIINALVKDFGKHDLKKMQGIKEEMLHFISNINFTKISNNSIRNNLYKFYRKAFEIKDLLIEVDTISDKITNKLESHQERLKTRSEQYIQILLAFIGIVLTYISIK